LQLDKVTGIEQSMIYW